ncbi:hypothetical protein J8N01_26000 [Priestia megaterium]|uniref:hypothetical protein n=1 Tax=Priestia megaterium TaxID=1404 RepID=UPI0023782AD6|nr:hypothetical protein [Priestia megaterium]WDM33694.1 hypothetical protein J8N01_26000 [Priestia megaterium]
MKTITINRTLFMGEKSVKKAEKIIRKIKSLKGTWHLVLTLHNKPVELLLIEDGEIIDCSVFKEEEFSQIVKEVRKLGNHLISMEVA